MRKASAKGAMHKLRKEGKFLGANIVSGMTCFTAAIFAGRE